MPRGVGSSIRSHPPGDAEARVLHRESRTSLRLAYHNMKLRVICKSKIHRAVVTGADLDYIGSIGIDRGLMRVTDIVSGEKGSVWNVNNGQRIETYAIALP